MTTRQKETKTKAKKKNPGGRPRKYAEEEVLQQKIIEYFKDRADNMRPPTVAGLALWLGFADRQSMYDYKKNEKFSCTIKKAVTMIEQYAEERLFGDGPHTGAIFWLKNHGWKDKTETDVKVGYDLFEEETEKKAMKYDKSIK